MLKRSLALFPATLILSACGILPIASEIPEGKYRLEGVYEKGTNTVEIARITCVKRKPHARRAIRFLEPGEQKVWVRSLFQRTDITNSLREAYLLFEFNAKAGDNYRLNSVRDNFNVAIWIEDAETGQKITEVKKAELTRPVLDDRNLRLQQCRENTA